MTENINSMILIAYFSVDCLGSFIQLLHLISEDTGVKEFLLKTVKSNVLSSETCSKITFTKDELPQVNCFCFCSLDYV